LIYKNVAKFMDIVNYLVPLKKQNCIASGTSLTKYRN